MVTFSLCATNTSCLAGPYVRMPSPKRRSMMFMVFVQINGETTSGGIAHWITSQVAGTVRTNATDWTAAYQPYIAGIINESVHHQVTQGGPLLAVQIGKLLYCHSRYRVWTGDLTQTTRTGTPRTLQLRSTLHSLRANTEKVVSLYLCTYCCPGLFLSRFMSFLST